MNHLQAEILLCLAAVTPAQDLHLDNAFTCWQCCGGLQQAVSVSTLPKRSLEYQGCSLPSPSGHVGGD